MVYVGGNGGVKPRHADVLGGPWDEPTTLRYLDRFLMYYILTADKLQRTAPWMDKHEGGVEAIRAIVLDDKLGIAAELEQRMQFLIDVRCAWAYLGSGSFEPFGI
jgi:NAD(P)H-nitrite reductase large subunit